MTRLMWEASRQTYRATLLEREGPGTRPCVTRTGTWLGCTECGLRCIFYAGGPKAWMRNHPERAVEAASSVAEEDFQAALAQILAGRKRKRGRKAGGPDDLG